VDPFELCVEEIESVDQSEVQQGRGVGNHQVTRRRATF
jgi:hypothetical protein